jgi:hypothetical protein
MNFLMETDLPNMARGEEKRVFVISRSGSEKAKVMEL